MTTIWIERLRQVTHPTIRSVLLDEFKDETETSWQWVPEQETLDTDADFKINDADIDRELCTIGQLMARYGALAAELNANLTRKEEEVKYVAARVSAALRSQAEVAGTKLTVDQVKEQTILHVDYQTTLSSLHLLRADAERAEHWWRSISAKAAALNSLTYWRGAEMRRT